MRNDYYYLEHSGIKGMKWGQRLYQNKDGSLTPLGRVRYAARKRAADKKRRASLEKARTEKQRKAEYEAKKQKVLKGGSAEEILKYRGDLTDQEMRDAISRLGLEKQLKQLQPPKHPKAKAVFDVVVDKVILPAGKEVLAKQLNKGIDAGVKAVAGKFTKDSNNTTEKNDNSTKQTKDSNKQSSSNETKGTGATGFKGMKWDTRSNQTANEKAASEKASKAKDWFDDVIDAEYTVRDVVDNPRLTNTGMLYIGTLLDK